MKADALNVKGYRVPGDEDAQRRAVVAEARSWLGTAFHSEGEIKCVRDAAGKIVDRGGTDCGKLIYRIFYNLGLIPQLDIIHYPPDWHMHRDPKYLEMLQPWTREITMAEVREGDIVLYKYGRGYSHGALIIDPGWPHIIHAAYDARLVLEADGTGGRQGGYPKMFRSYWGA